MTTRDVITVSLSNYAKQALRHAGWINSKNRTTGVQNLSDYISRLIVQDLTKNRGVDPFIVRKSALTDVLWCLQKQRDETERKMELAVADLKRLQEEQKKDMENDSND
jgi:hypothetical protein